MDRNELIKKQVADVVSTYFGQKLQRSFFDEYYPETLPIYIHTAYALLVDHIGHKKTKEHIDMILMNHNVKINYE